MLEEEKKFQTNTHLSITTFLIRFAAEGSTSNNMVLSSAPFRRSALFLRTVRHGLPGRHHSPTEIHQARQPFSSYRWVAPAAVSSKLSSEEATINRDNAFAAAAAVMAAAMVGIGVTSTTRASAEKRHHWTPSEVATENFDEMVDDHKSSGLPVYTSDQVADMNGDDGKPIAAIAPDSEAGKAFHALAAELDAMKPKKKFSAGLKLL